jgi:hypothetical protein
MATTYGRVEETYRIILFAVLFFVLRLRRAGFGAPAASGWRCLCRLGWPRSRWLSCCNFPTARRDVVEISTVAVEHRPSASKLLPPFHPYIDIAGAISIAWATRAIVANASMTCSQ